MNWFNNFFAKVFTPTVPPLEAEEVINVSGGATEPPVKTALDTADNKEALKKLVDQEYLLELEEKLLRLDCGLEFSEFAVAEIKKRPQLKVHEANELLKELCVELLQAVNPQIPLEKSNSSISKKLEVILILGVNGAGKTTSIGKLANLYKSLGKKVLIAPCDTFRAAAPEQLMQWAKRAGAVFFNSETAKKADAILFEAIQAAQAQEFDVLLVDTAGRLQNKAGLMDELSKLSHVIEKHNAANQLAYSRLLVLDASIGQNSLQQATLFNQACRLDGIILTKFDGSSKGGIIFAISHTLKLPIKYLGNGEQIHQLEVFQPALFVDKLLTAKTMS